jgi:hypothetical protein
LGVTVIRDLFFQGVSAPLRLVGADAILPIIAEVATGWPYRLSEVDPSAVPFFSITAVPDAAKVLCESHVDGHAPQLWDPVNAVCDALASLAMALPLSNRRLICLHAAGVEIAGRLVVFPSIRRAGKSTLSVALARTGHRIFSDDVVPLSFPWGGPAVAHAMGLVPRLRLPLPESLPADVSAWAAAMPGPRNRQYHYLPVGGQPWHGEQLPLGAFVLLDRRDETTLAQLAPVPPDAAMDALLHQNFTRDRHSGEVLEVIAATLAATPVWQLTYSDLGDAVGCLKAGFTGWNSERTVSGQERIFGTAVLDYTPAPMGRRLRQRAGVMQRWIGEVLYLADPEGRAIQRMDGLASAIWELLEEPVSRDDLEETLVEAFPKVPPERLCEDLGVLLNRLVEAGLCDPVE